MSATGTRSATACVRCRRMKTKCLHDDDGQPCRSCVKARQQCVFPGRIPRAPRGAVPVPAHTALTAPPIDPLHEPVPHQLVPEQHFDVSPTYAQDCEQAIENSRWPFPCFHRPSFVRLLKDGSLPKALSFAMLTSGARGSPGLIRHFGSPSAASDYFAKETQAVVFASMDCPSISDVQALCLLAMHYWGSGRGTRAYVYLGMAARMAQMFLPQAMSRNTDFVASEVARRTIWVCFIMDQFLSSGQGRPPAFREEDMHISLPCSEDDFHFGSPVVVPKLNGELPEHSPSDATRSGVGEFAHMIRVAILWRKAISWVLDPPVDEQDDSVYQQLETDLTSWQESLPSRQQDTPGKIDLHIPLGNGYAFAFTHCVYHCARIFLNRRQLHRVGRRGSTDSDHDYATHTIDTIFLSAHRITTLVTTLEASNLTETPQVYPIFVLFSAFTAGSTVAYMNIQEVTEARGESLDIIHGNLEVLRKSQHIWPLAEGWYLELSRMIHTLENHAAAQQNGPPPAVSGPYPELNGQVPGVQSLLVDGQAPISGPPPAPTGYPSPFAGPPPPYDSATPYDKPPAAQQADGQNEIDRGQFEQHLMGLDDLATFIGTDGISLGNAYYG